MTQAENRQETTIRRGPHGWVNWQAQRLGNPRRKTKHPDNVLIRPIWQEFALYTDAQLNGPWLTVGPYEFIETEKVNPARIGEARRLIVLRVFDHIEDILFEGPIEPATDIEDYTGGDIGDELSALLSLALARRIRSGGVVRQGLPESDQPLGFPIESDHRPPVLEPPRHAPMIRELSDPASLKDAEALLNGYPSLTGADAVALVRSARQYADGLWLADADPRVAWIKLVGALEAAAVRFDDRRFESAMDQLAFHNPELHAGLRDAPDLLKTVAEQTSQLFRVQGKLRHFGGAFRPPPPPVRPDGEAFRIDWDRLDALLRVIYEHRSRDLHAGIAFPAPLCDPPQILGADNVPAERFPALAVSTLGAEWTAEQLPMYLHVFAYLVGETLRSWWSSLISDPLS